MGCKRYRRGIFREKLLEIDCLFGVVSPFDSGME
jgi:hypothetical protein